MARICLLSTGQPSTNPRLVKEADALVEAGHGVRVLCSFWARWALATDRRLVASRRWACEYVGGTPRASAARYLFTRLRYGGSRRAMQWHRLGGALGCWALSRTGPELARAAAAEGADLYIAHNLGALPAAAAAARQHGAALGCDAEDFYSGMRPQDRPMSALDRLVEEIERRYLPRCDYVTAASDAIAEAYAERYGIAKPVPILNVFPLSLRPPAFRPGAGASPLRIHWFSQTIGPGRGLEDVARAVGLAGDHGIELHLRGVWSDGYRKSFLRAADAAGVRPAQLFDHRVAPPDDLVRLASEYDVGVAVEPPATRHLALCVSNKLLCYVLAGNAVAATATEGQMSVMRDLGQGGLAYSPGDVEALAAGLRAWRDDRRRLDAARRASWECGTRRYNWDLEKHRFLAVVGAALPADSGRQARKRAGG